jgi:ribosomal protein L7Ae-like RNA K-turn-binding protein
MSDEKILALLGLAHRAGQIATGAMQTEKAILSGKCRLLLIAADTAPDTVRRLRAMTTENGIPTVVALTKLQLGTAVGKSPKAAVAVNDIGFATSLRRLLSSDGV